MMRSAAAAVLLCFSLFSVAEEISVTLKPSKGLTGTRSITFHEDGMVTLLAYASPTEISSHTLALESGAVAELKARAISTLEEYLALKQFAQIPSHRLLLGIAVSEDEVTRSVSTRRLTDGAQALIGQLNLHLEEPYRIDVAGD